ncbi:hypothetical protein OSB04_001005 [Centaurea solstitialis]|uniref:Uncharacterized protein n=1 Tax=Centaurea solstitialis TaxID=347529 RepID=A0AA38WU70_9ASTR|nr:hypothetical protein OSB04_001005 [Centaurea solstitialis]
MTTSSPSNTLTPPTASQLVFALTNVYSQFSFKLSTDGSKYKLWRRIFLDMCKGAKVHRHITGKSKPAGDDDDWEATDSRIKSWFYSTCDANLLQIISSDNYTAKDLWDKLDEFFLNNKMSRMLQLQEQFRNTKKGTLSITDFCHNLKNLADALADCDSKIDEVELVMQILRQLPPSYHSIVDVITNTKPFPSFLEGKNMLLLHESREESVEPHIDTPLTSSAALYSSAQSAPNGKSKNKFNKGRNNGCVASKGGGNTNVSASSHSFAGNQGHSQAYFGTSPTTGHVPSTQPGLLGAPPTQPFGTGLPQPSPSMYSMPPQLPAPPFHQTPVNSHPYYYGIPPAPTPVSVSTQFAQHVQPSMLVPPPPQPSFGGHASQYSQPQYTDLSSVFQAMSVQPPQDNNFYMDTGASRHMTFNQGTMHSLTPCNSSFIQVGNGAVVPARYIGQCKLPFSPWPLMLKNVLVSDKLIKNLISVRRFTIDNSVSVEFDPFGFTVKDLKTGSFLQRCDSDHHDLYPVLPPSPQTAVASANVAVSFDVWHRRLGHPGAAVFQFLLSRKFIACFSENSSLCHACQLGKHCRLPFSLSATKTSRVFELIHSNLWTSPVTSLSGFKYYVLFLDGYSHFLWVFPLRAKSEVFSVFKTFRAYVLNQFKTDIQLFQCDNGREFNNQPFLDFFKTHGIKIRFSCPYTSQQNGKVERTIRTINNTLRTSLIQASLPPKFWVEALLSAIHTVNLLPSTTIHYKTPFEVLFGFFPTYSHLRVFGCLCYPNTSPTSAHKLAPRSSACVYLGPSTDHRGYRCLDLITQKVIISRHVNFDETHFPFPDFQPRPSSEDYDTFDVDDSLPSLSPMVDTFSPSPAAVPSASSSQPPPAEPSGTSSSPSAPSAESSQPPAPAATSGHPMTTRSRTGSLKPKQIFNLWVTSDISPIPRSTAQAMCDPHWRAAMDAEMAAILSNYTWDLVPKPSDVNILAIGFSQQPGLDFDDNFSPVVKPATIRTVLSISISRNWPIHQLDVKNAFLHGDLTETIYMCQPPGYVNRSFPDHVCRLRKALYGLKQAPRAWYHRFAVYLSSLGFLSSKTDTSLFTYHRGSDTIYLLLYVDDIILTASSPTLISMVISKLSSEFPMSDLGPLSFFLGIAASRSKSGLLLSQTAFAQEILARADMVSCNPCSTPADTQTKLAVDGEPVPDPTLYRSLAGALHYLTFTRPDIAYAVQQVCLFMHDPRLPHLNALKRISQYLKGTLSHGLHIKASAVDRLVAYSDADWAGCPTTRRSTSGFCVYLGDNLVSWSSKRQHVVSRSSAEAEYRGIANAVAETAWLRNLLLELCCPLSLVPLLSSVIMERVAIGHVRVLHVPSAYQYADIFTKGLPTSLFLDFRNSLNIRLPPDQTMGIIMAPPKKDLPFSDFSLLHTQPSGTRPATSSLPLPVLTIPTPSPSMQPAETSPTPSPPSPSTAPWIDEDDLQIPLREMVLATNNFARQNLIHKDEFEEFYKAQLFLSGQLVNVVAEVMSWASTLQRHVMVSIVGFCDENDELIVINEHLVNGSLDKHLPYPTLTWLQRLNICVSLAIAICFVDRSMITPGNIKSSKILLDKDWKPKLYVISSYLKRDFLETYDRDILETSYHDIVETFGALLSEVLCDRKKMIGDGDLNEDLVIVQGIRDGSIDPNLRKQMHPRSLTIFSETAIKCLTEPGEKRRSRIYDIMTELEKALELQKEHENADVATLSFSWKTLECLKIPLDDLMLSTKNFAKEYCIGSGAYGKVYKAELDHFDKRNSLIEGETKNELPKTRGIVAIKRISDIGNDHGEQGFFIELEMLSRCEHPNIISLLGFCNTPLKRNREAQQYRFHNDRR